METTNNSSPFNANEICFKLSGIDAKLQLVCKELHGADTPRVPIGTQLEAIFTEVKYIKWMADDTQRRLKRIEENHNTTLGTMASLHNQGLTCLSAISGVIILILTVHRYV
jgi:hypothetical protein